MRSLGLSMQVLENEVVSKEPLIVVVNDFATPAETAHLLSIAEGCANASFALCESAQAVYRQHISRI